MTQGFTEQLVVPGVLESLEEIARYVAQAAEAAGLPKGPAYRLRLATDEIVTNIITHGYTDDQRGDIELYVGWDERSLWMRIEDRAPPFDPFPHMEPADDLHSPLAQRHMGGLGLYLVHNDVDEFRYDYDQGRNRNTLVMLRDPVGGRQGG